MMKVLFLTFIPSPYRLSFFEELAQNCDLTVLFEREQSKYRNGCWNEHTFVGYKGLILRGITIFKQDKLCPGCIKYLTNKYDIIVISNPLSPTGFLAAFILKLKGIPYIVETDGAFPSGKQSFLQKLKGYVFKSASLCLSTSLKNDEYFIECGVKEDQLRRYPFTSIPKSVILPSVLSSDDKQALRKHLNMQDGFSVISVGRFVTIKGFDTILEVAEKRRDCSFYIIGGKPTDDYLSFIHEHGLTNVFFHDFMPTEQLLCWLKASDVFLMPTKWDPWGLVINEAIATGLPFISTDMCLSAVEIAGKADAGFITHVGDSIGMSELIYKLKSDPLLLTKLSNNALSISRFYTFENMASSHYELFREFIEMT